MTRPLVAGLAAIASGLAVSACAEVESNVRESYPYQVKPVKGSEVQRVTMTDETAGLIPVRTTEARAKGDEKVVPHRAVIYNPQGDAFVYTKPEPQTYVRAPIEIDRVVGGRALLSDGPPVGMTVVTLGAAELLATEYEILNQHP